MTVRALLIGFDEAVPEEQALKEALEEFEEAAAREDRSVVGTPVTTLDRSNSERTELGEYLVVISGEWSDGDK